MTLILYVTFIDIIKLVFDIVVLYVLPCPLKHNFKDVCSLDFLLLGTSSSDDGDTMGQRLAKKIASLYFNFELRCCIDLFNAGALNKSIQPRNSKLEYKTIYLSQFLLKLNV